MQPMIDAEAVINATSGLGAIASQINWLVALFQAVGGFVIAYIIFNIASILINRRKEKEIREIRVLLEKINRKLVKK